MIAEPTVKWKLEIGRVFTPNAPIGERDMFAGRTEQIGHVIDAVAQKGRHAIIYGERGAGKTSLVNVLGELLSHAEGLVLSPRTTARSTDTYASLWRKVFAEVSFTESRPGTIFGAGPGRSVRGLVDRLGTDITPDDVQRLLEQIAKGVLLVVIIDEFDQLERDVTTAFADTMKALTDRAVAATIVLVGAIDSANDLISQHTSVERALVQIQLPRMSQSEIGEIFSRGVKKLGMTIADEAQRQVAFLAQGLPYYAQLLGYHGALNACADGKTEIGIEHIRSAMDKAVENTQSSIRAAYNKAVESSRQDSLFDQVLLACALARTDDLGFFPAAAICQPMSELTGKPYEIPSFARHLKEFTETERGRVLERVGRERKFRYRFRNPLMQPYIIIQGLKSGRIRQQGLLRLPGVADRF